MDDSAPKNTIRAVQTTLDIIHELQKREGVRVTELANQLDVSKGTIHNHLSTLKRNQYVIKDQNDLYYLGLRFLDVAHRAKSRVRVYDLVRQEVDNLAEESGELVLFTVEEHGKGVCLYRMDGDQAIQTPLYVGHRSGLHHTAVGKSILANLSQERVKEILNRWGLPQVTANTITERDELRQELAEVRETGIAISEEETILGLVGVGAPITNQNGDVAGAISIIGPTSRMQGERLHTELPDMIRGAVNIIEVNTTSI